MKYVSIQCYYISFETIIPLGHAVATSRILARSDGASNMIPEDPTVSITIAETGLRAHRRRRG